MTTKCSEYERDGKNGTKMGEFKVSKTSQQDKSVKENCVN